MNLVRFKVALLERDLKQFEVARLLGWHPCKLSSVIRGHIEAKRSEAEAIAKSLGVSLTELFPELGTNRNGKQRVG